MGKTIETGRRVAFFFVSHRFSSMGGNYNLKTLENSTLLL